MESLSSSKENTNAKGIFLIPKERPSQMPPSDVVKHKTNEATRKFVIFFP
jgi:hypothetical protein